MWFDVRIPMNIFYWLLLVTFTEKYIGYAVVTDWSTFYHVSDAVEKELFYAQHSGFFLELV